MVKQVFVLLALTISLAVHAKIAAPNVKVNSIEKNADGDFVLKFDRWTGSEHQNITMVDNDGIATLAATQQVMVNEFRRQTLFNKYTMDTTYQGALHGIQKDALERLIRACNSAIGKGQGAFVMDGTGLTVVQVKKLATDLADWIEMRRRIKSPYAVRDLEKFGEFIKKMAPGGGPYPADYVIDAGSVHYDVRLKDPKPSESFLAGMLADGEFLPSKFVRNNDAFGNKSVWGDEDQLSRFYAKDMEPSSAFQKGIEMGSPKDPSEEEGH